MNSILQFDKLMNEVRGETPDLALIQRRNELLDSHISRYPEYPHLGFALYFNGYNAMSLG